MPNMIHLKGDYRAAEQPAIVAVKPGMLVEAVAGGVQPHTTAGAWAERCFALEDPLQGNITTSVYNTAATNRTNLGDSGATADQVQLAFEKQGNVVNALLLAGSNYTAGTKLISDGAGRLKPTSGSPTEIVAVIPQNAAVDLSASGAVDTLNPVRIL